MHNASSEMRNSLRARCLFCSCSFRKAALAFFSSFNSISTSCKRFSVEASFFWVALRVTSSTASASSVERSLVWSTFKTSLIHWCTCSSSKSSAAPCMNSVRDWLNSVNSCKSIGKRNFCMIFSRRASLSWSASSIACILYSSSPRSSRNRFASSPPSLPLIRMCSNCCSNCSSKVFSRARSPRATASSCCLTAEAWWKDKHSSCKPLMRMTCSLKDSLSSWWALPKSSSSFIKDSLARPFARRSIPMPSRYTGGPSAPSLPLPSPSSLSISILLSLSSMRRCTCFAMAARSIRTACARWVL
mmetsp:Transcript_122832/g.393483  ORF Transcript_122832/g.393483 Transcript_122832/m.393483 type:complete len:302 (-) Transcript_122832:858-1763(-)